MRDLHIHTNLCNHAVGEIEEYVESAISKNIKVIGFTDHTPLPNAHSSYMRMERKQMSIYSSWIQQMKIKYGPKIRILAGLEAEYIRRYHNYLLDLKNEYSLDYLIGTAHFYRYYNKWTRVFEKNVGFGYMKAFNKHMISIIESGLFDFIVEPDIYYLVYRKLDKKYINCVKAMLQTAKEKNIPLELNGYGIQRRLLETDYITEKMIETFWYLVSEENVKVLINSDAHSPENVAQNFDICFKMIEKYNLKLSGFGSF